MSNLREFQEKARELVSQMTLTEKAQLVSGFGMWETRTCERLGLKKIDMSDGPHGVRKQLDYYDIAVDESVRTVCWPSACCLSGSWDTGLLSGLGEALGTTAKIHDISLILGPGVNIKRSPLCGRNFEYFSEDPYLAGELAAAYIRGMQGTGVSSSVKHFAANNQETRRLTVNSVVEERALREIYLPAFEKAVKEAGVDVVMSAYNTLNGASCSQNERLLTGILRDEWQYDGMVVSDWGAVNDDIAALKAGNDLKMPGFEQNPGEVEKAVQDGTLSEAALNKAAQNVTALLLKANYIKETDAGWGKGSEDFEANHSRARKMAAESMVLLKNGGALPLEAGKKLLIVGEYAKAPHFQGGGSSHVNSWRVDGSLEFFAEGGWDYVYVEGFDNAEELEKHAQLCDFVIVFAGTSEAEESEGFDRETLDLPEMQNRAIAALCETGIPVTVVLFEGSTVTMPWKDNANAVLAAFLPGEAGGAAVYDILTGAVNPCGKLAETFAKRLCDTPAYLYFPGEDDYSFYGEGLFTGYRYYDTKQVEPLFPFGHGLSYTSFTYGELTCEKGEYLDTEEVCISLNITNTGNLPGKEIVQIYVVPDRKTSAKGIIRPVKELKAFGKYFLNPGETKQVEFKLNARAFAYFDTVAKDWRVNSGKYSILAGASSADIRGAVEVNITSTRIDKKIITRDSLMGDAAANPKGKLLLDMIASAGSGLQDKKGDKPGDSEAYMKMVLAMPIKTLILIGVPKEQVDALIDELNS